MLGPETPCEPWITEADLCCDTTGVDAGIVASSILAATEYLYDRTCRRWPGTSCTATIRPCFPCLCSCQPGNCHCRWTRYAIPAPYPILQVIAYVVDGVDKTADVRLDSARYLTLLDTAIPMNCFPPQNMGLPDGDPGTWHLQYRYGRARPELAKRAAADLACELIAVCGGEECKLPDGASSVSKRGVTVTFRGPQDGYTNIETADLLIAKYRCSPTATARIVDPAVSEYAYLGP